LDEVYQAGNLRQIPLGHSELESSIRYLAIDVNGALEISEQTQVRRHLLVAAAGLAIR